MIDNKIWQKYERCKDYLLKKNLVSLTDKYWDFYLGDQWRGMKAANGELPIMNLIKPVVKYKVSTVCQNNTVVNYSDSLGRDALIDNPDGEPISSIEVYKTLGEIFSACWEKAEMDTNVWDMIKSAAIAGDSYAFFGTKDVKDIQILSNMSVLLADEQMQDIQEQPFIIIRERLPVSKVKEIARENGIDEIEVATIAADEDTDYLINNKDDVEHRGDDGKVTSLLYMEKINGVVNISKCTEHCVYRPLAPIQGELNGQPHGGMKLYPIVNMVWEDCPNNARGQGEVKCLIPNQIEVNKTLARISMSVKMTAFPRIAYDRNAILNPDVLDKVGGVIEVNGGTQSINQMISYLNPMSMSSDARVFMNDMMEQTRELSGASDSSLGQISDPTRVAASALIAIRDQSALPLNEQVAKVKKLTEDLARLWPEIWFTYNPNGMTIAHEVDGMNIPLTITKEQIDVIEPDIRVDVSQDTPWTKNAEQQAADSLLDKGHITFAEYVEIVPDNGPVPKSKLRKVLDSRPVMPEGGEMDGMSEMQQPAPT